jgi:hypothetical protein
MPVTGKGLPVVCMLVVMRTSLPVVCMPVTGTGLPVVCMLVVPAGIHTRCLHDVCHVERPTSCLHDACHRDMTTSCLHDACHRHMTTSCLHDACHRDMTTSCLHDACHRDMTTSCLLYMLVSAQTNQPKSLYFTDLSLWYCPFVQCLCCIRSIVCNVYRIFCYFAYPLRYRLGERGYTFVVM